MTFSSKFSLAQEFPDPQNLMPGMFLGRRGIEHTRFYPEPYELPLFLRVEVSRGPWRVPQKGFKRSDTYWLLGGNGEADQYGMYMSYSLNSLKGGYIGDYIGDYYRAY